MLRNGYDICNGTRPNDAACVIGSSSHRVSARQWAVCSPCSWIWWHANFLVAYDCGGQIMDKQSWQYQVRRLMKNHIKHTQADDPLARKQRFADNIRAHAEAGFICIYSYGRDCDGFGWSSNPSMLPAVPTIVNKYIDNEHQWADGVISHTIIKPSDVGNPRQRAYGNRYA